MAGVGHLKRICKDALSVAAAVQETCSSELLGGPGADFLRGVDFGASVGLLRCRQVEWKNRKTQWHEAVSSALNFPFLKEVSQHCFIFDVVEFKN